MHKAHRARDSLWTFVGGQMYADLLTRKGNEVEAVRQRYTNEDARKLVSRNMMRHFPRAPNVAESSAAGPSSGTAAVGRGAEDGPSEYISVNNLERRLQE